MGVSEKMNDADRLSVLLHQLLFNEEAKAREACDFSLEVLKRNTLDGHAAEVHEKNCLRLEYVLTFTRRVQEVLDSFRFNGV